MEVVRARLTFPYKVGHFFKSADPLRADLVKIRNASRDLVVRPGAGGAWSGASGVPCGVFSRVAAVGPGGFTTGDRCIDGPREARDI